MKSSRMPVWFFIVLGVFAAALVAMLIWVAVPGGLSSIGPGPAPSETPTDEPTAEPEPEPTPRPTDGPTPTPTPTPTETPGPDDETATGPVRSLTGTTTPRSVTLTWINPIAADYQGAVVRRATGTTPPATATAGDAVAFVADPGTTVTDAGLTPGTIYSYAVFARDEAGNLSRATVATFTLPAPLTFGAADVTGAVTQLATPGGTLTDSGIIRFTAFDLAGARGSGVSAVTPSAYGVLSTALVEPSGANAGRITWTYTVSNDAVRHLAAGATRTETFTVTLGDGVDSIGIDVSITITGVDDAPVVGPGAVPDHVVGVLVPVSIAIPANAIVDPDGTPLTWSASLAGGGALPAWLTFDPATRTFSGTPQPADAGILSLVVSATDGTTVVQRTFALEVDAAPVANPDAGTWDLPTQPTGYSIDVVANDTDDDGPVTAVPASGSWTLDGSSEVAGTFTLGADGLLTLTPGGDPSGPLYLLALGQTATVTLSYDAVGGVSRSRGTVTITIVGTLGPV